MKVSKTLNIIILGYAGAGKTTHARMLARDLSMERISSGELLRQLTRRRTFSAKKLKKEMDHGNFAPTFLVTHLWIAALEKIAARPGIIFDGSPRQMLEAELIEEAFGWYERKNTIVILLDLTREAVFKRLVERKRSDDTIKAINERLDLFDSGVRPVIKYYEQKSLVVPVDVTQEAHKVHKDILKALSDRGLITK